MLQRSTRRRADEGTIRTDPGKEAIVVPRLSAYLLNTLYLTLLVGASPWLLWTAWRTGKYRAGFAPKLLGHAPLRRGDRPCIWLHAVSVGEVNLLGTLIEELKTRRPEADLVLSTTTKTGYEVAQKKYAELTTFYCPLDFSWAVDRAIQRIRPDLLVLAELELWPNLIRAAKGRGVPVAVVNGRISDSSYRGYQRICWLIGPLLRQLDVIGVQDEAIGERFRCLGAPAEKIVVTGSLKYDGAETERDNPRTRALRRLAALADGDQIWLAGSTQEPEESYVIEAFAALSAGYPQLRLVFVPRHPERFDEVAALLDQSGLTWQRRTELDEALGEQWRTQVLLVDAMGELGAWWGMAKIAYVGGSLGSRGGQNMIEPAAYGAAVCFGPNTRNFRDIVARLLEADAAVVVADKHELRQFVEHCLDHPEEAAALGQRAQQLVKANLGATPRTVDLLSGTLSAHSRPAVSKTAA